MPEEKNKVEAVLFTTGRFLRLDELAQLSGIASVGILKELLLSLQQEYTQRDSAMELIQQGEQWKLTLKKNYLPLTENLLTDAELDRPTQETLAVVAYKSPVIQSDVIKIRGTTAYDHLKILQQLEFVTAEKSGRTKILKISPKFYDYFDVVADQLQSKMAATQEQKPEPAPAATPQP
ncbi:SMC-Scp complex subunit ScpB [Candidatus Woesearchaeota archaeon]|nr:SMC-Scp complex subunit ScpB [Candidatus Woesearchaeota archaeon]